MDLGVPRASIEEAADRWREAYGFGEGSAAFPGVVAALERLAQGGFKLGLVTAGDRDVVTQQARQFGLDPYLTVRVHADDLPFSKPHPEPLRHALAQLGVADPGHATYLGDVPDDMRMARAVGSKAVGIVGRLGTPDELFEAGAHDVRESVVAWVDEFLGAACCALLSLPMGRLRIAPAWTHRGRAGTATSGWSSPRMAARVMPKRSG
jgi:HAD superfamily hydrolase (TIGR01549 family)